jgi:hypothetical protein
MNKANYHHELTLKKSTSSLCSKSENITENIEKLIVYAPEQVAGPAKLVAERVMCK